jgi:hypothetical protein
MEPIARDASMIAASQYGSWKRWRASMAARQRLQLVMSWTGQRRNDSRTGFRCRRPARARDQAGGKHAIRDEPLAFAVEVRGDLVEAPAGPWRQRRVVQHPCGGTRHRISGVGIGAIAIASTSTSTSVRV